MVMCDFCEVEMASANEALPSNNMAYQPSSCFQSARVAQFLVEMVSSNYRGYCPTRFILAINTKNVSSMTDTKG